MLEVVPQPIEREGLGEAGGWVDATTVGGQALAYASYWDSFYAWKEKENSGQVYDW